MKTNLSNANIKPSGLLNEKTSLRHFNLDLYQPPEGLEGIVNSVWHVSWTLPEGQSYLQTNIPHPTQHLVLDPLRGSGLFGCSTKKFDYEIVGTGQVLGLKLFPAMGRCFLNDPMSKITDNRINLEVLIGSNAITLEGDLKGNALIADTITKFGQTLTEVSTRPSQAMIDVRNMVEYIETTQKVFRVSELAAHFSFTTRQLQRLFSSYVGVSPKWVIDRYRMLEAVDVLNSGTSINLSELALDLQYVDQAHFSNQFKAITGISPSAYLHQ